MSQCDVGLIYDEPRHALINKWLLLSNPAEASEGVRGFLKICAAVIGPNDDAPVRVYTVTLLFMFHCDILQFIPSLKSEQIDTAHSLIMHLKSTSDYCFTFIVATFYLI